MRLPSKGELNIHNSPDEMTACEHFYNKTLPEAEALLRENSAYYQEDLMWMGPVAFNFYLDAVINYLQSESSAGDDHFIDSFYRVLEFRSDEKELEPARDKIVRLIDYVINNYKKFSVDSDIYGDLIDPYKQLRHKFGDSA